jgi:hypothetical protein
VATCICSGITLSPCNFESLRARRTDCYVLAARQILGLYLSFLILIHSKFHDPFQRGGIAFDLSSASSAFSNGETESRFSRSSV